MSKKMVSAVQYLRHVLHLNVVRNFSIWKIILTINRQADIIAGYNQLMMLNDNVITVAAGAWLDKTTINIIVWHRDIKFLFAFD